MDNDKKEIITINTINNKDYKMRQFSALCKYDLLLCCNKCSQILCSSTLIDKILRLSSGKICFIMEDGEDGNSEMIEEFQKALFIENIIYLNPIKSDFKAVGVNEVFCKKCKNPLGLKMRTTDDVQIFMINRILLKLDFIKVFKLDDYGIKLFNFYFKKDTIKSMDKEAFEADEYIQKSGNYIQTYFDMLSSQNKEIKNMEKRKEEIDKLGNVLKYLVDKKYI